MIQQICLSNFLHGQRSRRRALGDATTTHTLRGLGSWRSASRGAGGCLGVGCGLFSAVAAAHKKGSEHDASDNSEREKAPQHNGQGRHLGTITQHFAGWICVLVDNVMTFHGLRQSREHDREEKHGKWVGECHGFCCMINFYSGLNLNGN